MPLISMDKCWLQVISKVLLFVCVYIEITYPQFMAYVMTISLSPFTVLANGLCQKEYVCKTIQYTLLLKRMKNTLNYMIPDTFMEVKTHSVVFWGYDTR